MHAKMYGGDEIDLTRHIRGFGENAYAIFEAELDDGRTVQLSVHNNGRVFLRGWGNIPKLVGNSNTLELTAVLAPEPPLPEDQQCNY